MFIQTTRLAICFLITMISLNTLAKKKYHYPELQVSPLASERLVIETKNSSHFLDQTTLFLPALATLMTGVVAQNKTNTSDQSFDDAQKVTILTGGATLLTAVLISSMYRPYQTGLENISSLPRKNTQQEIVRERIAEEAIKTPAYLIKRAKWISVFLNTASSVYMAANGNDRTAALGAISALTALSTIFFKHPWQKVSEQQEEYKKRIYGPIFGVSMLQSNNRITPGFGLTYSF